MVDRIVIPGTKHPPTNHPRDVIVRMAEEAIRRSGGPAAAKVFFKFTCVGCGTRCTFNEPNALYERGECASCGLDQPITEAGFALLIGGDR